MTREPWMMSDREYRIGYRVATGIFWMWVAALVFLIALLAWPWPANAAPCRPTGIDVSARLPTGSALAFFPMRGTPTTSTQSVRACLDDASLDRLTELVLVAGDLAPNAMGKAIDAMNLAFTRIEVVAPYRGALQAPAGGVWITPVQGRIYQAQQIGFDAFAYELTSSRVRGFASARFTTRADLRDVLDVDPLFSPAGSAPFVLPPTPPLDTTRASRFPVDTRTRLPACGNGDCSGLAAVHAAHACVAAAKVAGTSPAACPSVVAAHLVYELGCRGEEKCEAFRRVHPFRGDVDTKNLTPTLLALGFRLQDVFHAKWAAAQAAGDWKASDLNDIRHLIVHSGLNVADPRRLFVFPCDLGTVSDPLHGKIDSFQDFGTCFGGKQTIQTLLPKLAAAYL